MEHEFLFSLFLFDLFTRKRTIKVTWSFFLALSHATERTVLLYVLWIEEEG